MVFGSEDHPRDAGGLRGADPLSGIEFGRIELLRILSSVAPFPVGKGVHAEVDERGDFVALPGDLPAVGRTSTALAITVSRESSGDSREF